MRLLILFLLLTLSALAAPNPPLEAAERLLPRLPTEARFQLLRARVSRGDVSRLPKTLNPQQARQLLMAAPNPVTARGLTGYLSRPQLLQAANHHRRPEVAREILHSLSGLDPNLLARADLAAGQIPSQANLTDPAVLEFLGRHDEASRLSPRPRSQGQAALDQWRRLSAERVAVLLAAKKPELADPIAKEAHLGAANLQAAAERLKNKKILLAVAIHNGDEERMALLQLPTATPGERDAIVQRVIYLGEGMVDMTVPINLLNQIAPLTTRETYEKLYRAADDTLGACSSIEMSRALGYGLQKSYEAWSPPAVLEAVFTEKKPARQFQLLIRLGTYYPSQNWPIQPDDLEQLKRLPRL